MPFRSLRPEERGATLAGAPMSAAAREFYSDKQSSVYTTKANAAIQRDLTRHALELLQLQPHQEGTTERCQPKDGIFWLLDLGAGSGLSTKAAGAWFREQGMSAFTVAFDISASMLSLASKEHGEGDNIVGTNGVQQCADFFCGNAVQQLPLRKGLFDAAIGISMLQWLQPRGLEVCFSSLLEQFPSTCDSRAIFQVYPPSLEYVDIMEETALRTGFDLAEVFVSFPHTTTAKKWFLCLEKRGGSNTTDQVASTRQGVSTSNGLCLFARRYGRRCALQWLGDGNDGSAKDVRERLEREHVKTAWHIWRKYRRSQVIAASSSDGIALHAKAHKSLELYLSDKVIGRALQARFETRAGGVDQISHAFFLEHRVEVVVVLHSAYAESAGLERSVELDTSTDPSHL